MARTLLQRHEREVFTYLVGMLGQLQDAEDALQETLLRAHVRYCLDRSPYYRDRWRTVLVLAEALHLR